MTRGKLLSRIFPALIGVLLAAVPAFAQLSRSRAGQSLARDGSVQVRSGVREQSDEFRASEEPASAADLTETVVEQEAGDLGLTLLGSSARMGAASSGPNLKARGSSGRLAGIAKRLGIRSEIQVGAADDLSDAVASVGKGKEQFDLAARGLANSLDVDPIIVNLENGKARAYSLLVRDEEKRAAQMDQGIFRLPRIKTVATAGLFTLLSAGVALADTGATAFMSPALMSWPALVGTGFTLLIPPALIAALPPRIMGRIQTRFYKEIKTLEKLEGTFTYREYAESIGEVQLLHQYRLLYSLAKERYPRGYGWRRTDITEGFVDPARIRSQPKEEHDQDVKKIRDDIVHLDLRLKERDTFRTSDLADINFIIAVVLGGAISVAQYLGLIGLNPSMGSVLAGLFTTASVGAGASYLWYRGQSVADRTAAGPKSF